MKQAEKRRVQFTGLTPSVGTDEPVEKRTGDVALDVTVPSVSGFYIELSKQGKLQELTQLDRRRKQLHRELADIEMKLQQINDPAYLLEFGRRRANFPLALQSRATGLEESKRKKRAQLSEVESRIAQIDPAVLNAPITPTRDGVVERDSDAQKRNEVIRELSRTTTSSLAICKQLDLMFLNREAPPTGIPAHWVKQYAERWQKYGWRFYEAAYRDPDTKNRMQKMISAAKRT